ncbi:MAG: hypothetical protein K0R17_784 [Rariglobus sp.]|jgi:autotransporter-associated beta strand protein|nr:hypothetical protein [Rariglobus sp.]
MLSAAGILLASPAMQAATLSWDSDGIFNNGTLGGTGAWNTSSAFWDDGTTDTAWATNTITDDTALFAGTAGTVTLGSAINALGLQFITTGYTIATGANTLTLGAGGIDASGLSSGTTALTGLISLGSGQSWNVGSGSILTSSAVISGTGNLVKTGAGTLTLTNATNTFSGGLTINAGVVSIDNNVRLGGASGTAGAVTLDGGTLRTTNATALTNTHAVTIGASGGTLNIAGGATTGQGSRVIFGTANTLLGSGALTVTGNGTVSQTGGSGVLVLTAANNGVGGFSGNITLQDGGLLAIEAVNGLASAATVTLGNNSEFSIGTGSTTVTAANNITVNGTNSVLSFTGSGSSVYSGSITLNADLTVSLRDWYQQTGRNGVISGTISGSKKITVNTTTANTGTGNTLTLAGFDAKASSADWVMNGANLSINSNSGTAVASVARGNSLTINTGNLTVTGVASQATNDVFGTLNLGGGSSGNLQGYSTWTLTPNAATNAALTFTNMGTRTAGSWVALTGTFGGTPAANMGNIYFTNGLSGANLIGAGGTLASGTASVIPWLRDNGGNTIYGYDATNGVAAITSVSTTNLNTTTSGQNIVLGGTNGTTQTLTGDKTINSLKAGFINVNMGGNTLTVASGVITADNSTFSNGTLNFDTAEGQLSVHNARTLTINSAIAGSGGLTYVGFRTTVDPSLILAGANTYTGVTNFYGYGGNTNVRLTNSLALQNSTLNHVASRGYTMTFGNGGTSGQTAYTFGGLSGNANLNLNNNNTTVGAVALTVGGNNASTTYSGVLSSTVAGGSLTKAGSGTLTLSGVNTYTGATTVSDGTLALASTGTLASTAYTVANGAVFNASTKSSYSLASVATTIGVGATTAGFFNGPSGALTLGNSLTLDFSTSLLANGQTYNLFDFGSQTGDFSSVTLGGSIVASLLLTSADTWTGSDSLNTYTFSFSEVSGILSVSAVPEPSTYAVLVGVLIFGTVALRRRRASLQD